MLADPFREMVMDKTLNLDITRIIHGEYEIIFERTLRPSDKVKISVKLESLDVKASGEILWARIDGYVENETSFIMRAGLFFKKLTKGNKRTGSKKKSDNDERKIIFSKKMTVTPDQSKRYAEVSGDRNPIHVDRNFARAAGLPDIILHGLCTLAFSTAAIVENFALSPSKVKRVRTRLSKPVFMNDVLTTQGWVKKKKNITKLIGLKP